MKRILSVFSVLLVMLIIVASCGDTEQENLPGEVQQDNEVVNNANDESDNDEATPDNDSEETVDNEINEVIVDGDVKATLVKITKESDSIFGNRYKIVFDIENNLDHSIEVQARSVSTDDRMVDETIYSMSQEIAPGKSANAVLTIEDFEGYDFPEMNDNFEMILHIFSWDDMDYTEDHEVKVEF